MAATKYGKSITTDFIGLTTSTPHVNTLMGEVRNSSIVTALDYINMSGDDVDLWFRDTLSQGDEAVLSSIVAAHTGEPVIVTQPQAEDGKLYVTPDLFPLGYFAVHAGCGDDVSAGKRGEGQRFKAAIDSEGSVAVGFQFIDHVLLAGGSLYRMGGDIDDFVDFKILAPATQGISSPGAGGFDKYDVGGGLNMYVPNGSQAGGWDVDLSEKLNGFVAFTKAVPVPSSSKTGWFDYNIVTNTLSLNADQRGAYHLFDADLDITRHVTKAPLLGEGKMCSTVAAVKPALVLPHWKFETTITHGEASNSLKVVWKLFIGRKNTV